MTATPDMHNRLRSAINRALRRRAAASGPVADESEAGHIDPQDLQIIERAMPYTMTGKLRLQALIDAVRYCERRGIPGAFAECGVWRGGSVLAMIGTLQQLGSQSRDIYLMDTFQGMTAPSELDVSMDGESALETWKSSHSSEGRAWSEFFGPEAFSQEAVRQTVLATGYPEARIHIVPGPVEETVPVQAPKALALLRLDTDWYESTRHELVHLYPRLATGGVLIIDDYGHWAGCKRAVDEYFEDKTPLLFGRIDYTGRIAINH